MKIKSVNPNTKELIGEIEKTKPEKIYELVEKSKAAQEPMEKFFIRRKTKSYKKSEKYSL